eukprot:6139478-Amphidinium_carterae.1
MGSFVATSVDKDEILTDHYDIALETTAVKIIGWQVMKHVYFGWDNLDAEAVHRKMKVSHDHSVAM